MLPNFSKNNITLGGYTLIMYIIMELLKECVYCNEEFETLKGIEETRCKHLYHESCMDEQVSNKEFNCKTCDKYLFKGLKKFKPAKVKCEILENIYEGDDEFSPVPSPVPSPIPSPIPSSLKKMRIVDCLKDFQ